MKAKVLETRKTPEGFKRRRYETDEGVRYSTIEVPEKLWAYMNKAGRANDRAEQVLRTMEREKLRASLTKRLLAGEKAVALAHEAGLDVRTVQRWRVRVGGYQ